MDKKKIRALIFLVIGAGLFWWVYRDMDLSHLRQHLPRIGWGWIGISLLVNLVSQLIKALRWRLLILPLDYRPGTANLFLSNLVLSFTNLIIPRGGEIARLGVIRQYEGIPLIKLLGTALVERLTDVLVLLLLTAILIAWQWERITRLFASAGIQPEPGNLWNTLLVIGIISTVLYLAYRILQKTRYGKAVRERVRKALQDLGEGWRTFGLVRRKGLYLFFSFLQFGLWLVMLYVIFFAYPPTRELSLAAAAFTFGFSTLAFLVPVQAGIGAWHFLVIQALTGFGVSEPEAQVFALIAHTFTQLIHLGTGAIAFVLLPMMNPK